MNYFAFSFNLLISIITRYSLQNLLPVSEKEKFRLGRVFIETLKNKRFSLRRVSKNNESTN